MPKQTTIKKSINGVIISIVAASVGMTGDFYLNKNINILGDKYTKHEYNQIKKQIIDKTRLKEKKTDGMLGASGDVLTSDEIELWLTVANIEAKKCGGFTFKNNDYGVVTPRTNSLMEQEKCSE